MKKESPSTHGKPQQASRRQFFAQSGKVAVASALAGAVVPRVHAAENNTIRLALIGCGSRGSGAVGNAMNSANGPVKLVAMADLVESRLTSAHKILGEQFGDGIDVPKDRQFIGFDAYKKAIDCLGPGDVAMLTNFAAFRAMQLEYAVKKGGPDELDVAQRPVADSLDQLLAVRAVTPLRHRWTFKGCWAWDTTGIRGRHYTRAGWQQIVTPGRSSCRFLLGGRRASAIARPAPSPA